MKIGYLCSDFDVPLYGPEGCSIHVRELTHALRRAGHNVFFVCAELGADEPAEGDRVYVVRPPAAAAHVWDRLVEEEAVLDTNLERDLRLLFYNEWLRSEGPAILAAERPDALYERYALFGLGGVELAGVHGLPHLLEVNTDLRHEQEGYDKFVLSETARIAEREAFGGTDALIAVSAWLGAWARTQGAPDERVHVIPNAVSDELFAQVPPRKEARARFGLDGERVVGFVGSFQPWHDVRGLLDAFTQLHESESDLRLLVVGQGEEKTSLEAATQRRGLEDVVTFTGRLPHAEIPHALAAMDVAVAPYDGGQELGFLPLKLFEYMASGTPVVAAAVGEIPSFVDDGTTGLLYPAADNDRLATAILRLLRDREFASGIGRRARAKILADHTWASVARRVIALAEPLTGRR